MTHWLISTAADLIWPRLGGDPNQYENQEGEKLAEEKQAISEAITNLPSDEDELKGYLAASEKLLEAESSRKGGIESRLLNAAGLFSIAGTVVLGALFSLADEKLTLNSPWAKTVLTLGCLYLAIQLAAALHAAVKGLQATGYGEDQPHELLPRDGLKRTVYLRERIECLLARVAEHRRVNDGKLSQLKIAHCAMRNFLWGLLGVAVACALSVLWPSVPSEANCPTVTPCGTNDQHALIASLGSPYRLVETRGVPKQDVGLSVILISGGMSIATLGVALFAAGGTTVRRGAGIAMAAGGLGLSVLGGGELNSTILKIDKLIGDLRLELSLGTKLPPQQVFIRRLLTVGPFPDGDHLLAEEQVAKCVSSALAQYNGMRIGGWEVVGRVDKRQLKVDRAAIYGSNQALAMSRASWVAQKFLTSQPSFDLAHAVITVGGARGVGSTVATNDLQSDRAVDVFAVVNADTDVRGAADLPDPVVCPSRSVPR